MRSRLISRACRPMLSAGALGLTIFRGRLRLCRPVHVPGLCACRFDAFVGSCAGRGEPGELDRLK
jgi:hypothetical protein